MKTRQDPLQDTELLTFPSDDWTQGSGNTWSVVETVLWTIAVACLMVVTWNLMDASLYQQRAATALVQAETLPPGDDDGGVGAVERVATGAPVGRLEIPRLDLSVVVAEGADESVLRRAVGRIPSSDIPGDGGNLALAGHRDTFFRPLQNIQVGDLLTFQPAGGSPTTYRVRWTRVVDPNATWVAAPTLEPVLTLVTCYPFTYVGAAPQRFVVRAERVDDRHLCGPPTDLDSAHLEPAGVGAAP